MITAQAMSYSRSAVAPISNANKLTGGDLAQITAILQQNYQQVKQALPGVSYTQFKYTLAQINRRVIERN